MKYIDADKLYKKIDERMAKFAELEKETEPNDTDLSIFHQGKRKMCSEILTLITSLQQEQPKVDLEEYIENEINHYGLSLYEASYGTFSASRIDRIIRNAFELGLNARKEK